MTIGTNRTPLPVAALEFFTVAGLYGCGGGGGSGGQPAAPPRVASIAVTPDAVALGATVQLSAQVLDADGEEVSVAVHWESADPLVATVDASGRVTARANGVADITASVDSRSASATVTVQHRVNCWSIEPWSNNQNPLTFESLGDTVQFSVDPRDANGYALSDDLFFWQVPDRRIARIRDGSTWYLRVSGDGRPATAIGVENPVNKELPDEIQVWVVRLE